jgi:hypothetical protein
VVSSHACGHLSSLLLEYGRLACTLFTCPVFGEYYNVIEEIAGDLFVLDDDGDPWQKKYPGI